MQRPTKCSRTLTRLPQDTPPSKRSKHSHAAVSSDHSVICRQLREITGSRASKRIQAQVVFTGTIGGSAEPTGLFLVVAVDTASDPPQYITDAVYPLLWWLLHPDCPIATYRLTQEQFTTIPMNWPKILTQRIGRSNTLRVTMLIRRLVSCNFETEGERQCIERFSSVFPEQHARLTLCNSTIEVRFEQVNARFGELVCYRGFHGNVSAKAVTVVGHIDALPRSHFSDLGLEHCADDIMARWFDAFAETPLSIGAGSGRAPTYECEYYRSKLGGKVPPLPECPTNYLGATTTSTSTCSSADLYALLRFPVELSTRGYCVFDLASLEGGESWIDTVLAAREEFMRFFNWALFERSGRTDLGTLSLDNRDDTLWDILESEARASSLTGNRFIMYTSHKDDQGKIVHSKTAQRGKGLCTSSYGMGHATNFYRGTAWLAVGSHPLVQRAMTTVYGGEPCYMIPERLRVKCGTRDPVSDKYCIHNRMQPHEDRCFPFAQQWEQAAHSDAAEASAPSAVSS